MLEGNSNGIGVRVNGHWYDRYYLLADNIYLKWSCFVQRIQNHEDFNKKKQMCRNRVKRMLNVALVCSKHSGV